MPIYEYKHINQPQAPCEKERFEVVQKMSDSVLQNCPDCGVPVQKLISMPARHQQSDKDKFSDKNIAEKGFSKYVKTSDGTYEKAAGPADAPSTLDRNVMKANLDSLPDD